MWKMYHTHMKTLIPLLAFLAPSFGLCAESTTLLAAGSTFSSTLSMTSCLVPGMKCTREEVVREHAAVAAELGSLQAQLAKIDAKKGKHGRLVRGPTGDAERDTLYRRMLGFRRLECRLREMKRKMPKSSTEFVEPGK
jgi:hypothetical protein